MSQIRSFDDALDFYPEAKATLRTRIGGFAHALAAAWNSVIEGHAAARHYEQLRHRGLSHDRAATQVFADHYR